MPIEFQPFPSISRLFRECVVTEKVDGSNAQITIDPDTEAVIAGSRNRLITPEDDNFGFAKWVKTNEDELRKLGYGTHYGEWYGSGIQRGYGLKEKRFALFNVHKWGDVAVRPSCCDVVPILYRGDFDTTKIREVAEGLRLNGSVIAPGFGSPEGVVVYHVKSGQLFKFTFDKHDGHKSA